MDTIFALATARGKAGVAVVRISGPAAFVAAEAIAGCLPDPRYSALRRLRSSAGDTLDDALVLVFAPGSSFTGEAVVEFHLHGSTAVVAAVLRELGGQPGLRMAEAGEFTRRALQNGRLDLAQVEGLADLIDAETEAQRRQAQRVLSGAVGQRAEGWRRGLIRVAALLEATIDFADEDVPVDVTSEVLERLDAIVAELRAEVVGAVMAERIRDGFEVAIVGRPNAGKSTLLNALAGRQAAITSDVAGTTRDVIEVRMDLGGLPVTVLDSAGLRAAGDELESMGVARALERARQADLRVFLCDDAGLPDELTPMPEDLIVQGKADVRPGMGLRVSGTTGQGVAELVRRVADRLGLRAAGAQTITRERHRVAVLRAIGAMESARVEVLQGPDRAEIAAEEMHRAIRALDSLVGRIDVEHLLGEIFASFCIGK